MAYKKADASGYRIPLGIFSHVVCRKTLIRYMDTLVRQCPTQYATG